jgi:hypothetical protein
MKDVKTDQLIEQQLKQKNIPLSRRRTQVQDKSNRRLSKNMDETSVFAVIF